jgi:hypothetical protein
MMRSLLEDSEAERLPFIGSATIDTPVPELAHRIARQINFDLNKFRQQNTVEDAFSYLRSQIENGLSVSVSGEPLRRLSQHLARGVCSIVPEIVGIGKHEHRAAVARQ